MSGRIHVSVGKVAVVTVTLLALGLVAVPAASQAQTIPKVKTARMYYLSLGDSYSVGYQPGK
ncbi:MAG: hypothetical protein ACLPYY_10845, partial [Acidimicrobiales bacterium]